MLRELDRTDEEFAGLLRALEARHGAALVRLARHMARLFLLQSPWAPGLRFVGGVVAAAAGAEPHFDAGSASHDLIAALAGCLGEAAERVAQVEQDGDVAQTASPAALGASLPEPVRRMAGDVLIAANQPPETRVDWIGAQEVSSFAPVLVPADWVLRRPAGTPLQLPGARLSIGCAAGPDGEFARERALLELIERDAAALWWHAGRRGDALSPAVEADARRYLDGLRLGNRARRTWFLDITTEIGVPVIAAMSQAADGSGFACGLAARLDPAEAACAAIRECLQMEIGLWLACLRLDQAGAAALTPTDRRHLARAVGIKPADCDLLHPLRPGRHRARAVLPLSSGGPSESLASALAGAGMAAYFVDLTRAAFGIPVVKAVAPGLQSWPSDVVTPRLAAAIAQAGDRGGAMAVDLF